MKVAEFRKRFFEEITKKTLLAPSEIKKIFDDTYYSFNTEEM